MKRVSLKITGRVQGVFFRQSTQEKARQLGLSGFVKNEADGSVYVEAAGNTDKVHELIIWCHKGPPSAAVKNVEVEDLLPGQEISGIFEILR